MTEERGYQSPSTLPGSAGSGIQTDQPSAAQVAREQAGEVGQSAQHAGQQVAQTAVDQAKEVASEAGRQARDLLAEARTQARTQTETQRQRAVDGLHGIADELRGMVDKGGQSGVGTELVQNAYERLHGMANWLDQRSAGGLVDEVRDFARRRPGVFLMGAALAGVVAGRLTRNVAAQQSGGPARYAPDTGYPARHGAAGEYGTTGYRSGEYGGTEYRSGEYGGGTGSYQAGQYGATTGDYPTTGQRAGTEGYRAGTEGYRAGTEGYRAGTEGYRAGTEGYRAGTEGYEGSDTYQGTEPPDERGLPGDSGPARS
jgi:hypothetical protein